MTDPRPNHDGATFDRVLDLKRLGEQMRRVYLLMQDGKWRTLPEICAVTNDETQSVSARLRDFRKEKFGGHTLERRRRGDGRRGLWEYRLLISISTPAPTTTNPVPPLEA